MKQPKQILDELIEHYNLLNLFDKNNISKKIPEEIQTIYGFIKTLQLFDIEHCLPPKISPNTYEQIQDFLDENAFNFMELTLDKNRLQTVWLPKLEELQNNTIKYNRSLLEICKKRNINFVLPLIKKFDDDGFSGPDIGIEIKKKKDLDLDI